MATFFNPENGQVLAFLVGLGRVLTPSDVIKWDKDGIQVNSSEAFISPTDILRLQEYGFKTCLLQSKKVISKSGKSLGRVRDFTVDTSVSQLLKIHVAKGFLFWTWSARSFSFEDISQITDKHVQLRLEPDDPNALDEVKHSSPLPV